MAEVSDLAHDWQLTPAGAIALQDQLRALVRLPALSAPPLTIAGADISYNRFSDIIYAGIIVLDYPSLRPRWQSTVIGRMTFPYVPGLLSFRELPAVLEAWKQLSFRPDVVMLDGQGIAHPRRLGIASHFGLITGCPSLGCAKSVLVGKFDPPPPSRGSRSAMLHGHDTVGYALRTKDRVNPVYVSPGHGLSLEDAVSITLTCARGYRIPEPTRQAHLLVNALRRGEIAPGLQQLDAD